MRSIFLLVLSISLLLASCTRSTRIGHTRYPIGTAESKRKPESYKAIRNIPLPVPEKVVQAETDKACTSSSVQTKQEKHGKPVDNALNSKPLPPASYHETLRISPPDSTIALDTFAVLQESARLLKISNASFLVGFILGFFIQLVLFIFLGVMILGSLVVQLFLLGINLIDTITLPPIELPSILYYLEGLKFLTRLVWLYFSGKYWIKFGQWQALAFKNKKTRSSYILHIIALVLFAINISWLALIGILILM